jgi:hypothetical protein
MNDLVLGRDANSNRVVLSEELRKQTHFHVIGGSGTGKSKFLESLIRSDIHNGQGLCLIDWHGNLFADVLKHCAESRVGLELHGFKDFRNLVLLDASSPDFVIPFNPFQQKSGSISTQASNLVDATIKAWGEANADRTPTLERVLRMLFSMAIEMEMCLPEAINLLYFEEKGLRDFLSSRVRSKHVSRLIRRLSEIKKSTDWDVETLSAINRLTRFLASDSIRRHIGIPGGIDIFDVMEKQHILLVNLAQSPFLSVSEARVLACWILNEFFQAALRRAQKHSGQAPLFVLYLDEFQEYMTDDLSAMLDQVRKGGLHIVMAHQHSGHFVEDPRLKKSVFTNARIRAVFGGLDYEDGTELANEMFLSDLNTRQIKKALYHTIHLYREEWRQASAETSGTVETTGSAQSYSDSRGHSRADVASSSSGHSSPLQPLHLGEGWFSYGTGTARNEGYSDATSDSESFSEQHSNIRSSTIQKFPAFVPVPVQELASETEWSLEEKRSKVVEMLKYQQRQHCFIKIGSEKTQPMLVETIPQSSIDEEQLNVYRRALFEAEGALSGMEAERLIEQRESELLKKSAFQTNRSQKSLQGLIGSE